MKITSVSTRQIFMAGVAFAAIAAGSPAAAQSEAEADSTTLDEVIVTAERRNTPLQTTPISVGVLGGEQVQQQHLTLLRDLGSSVASLQTPASSTPSMGYVFIRGIGTVSPTYNAAVGIYVDDIYQARVINSGVFGLPDIEQIEVLRGPQGTLYGQNTSAGAIKIISRTPADYLNGSLTVAAGNNDQFNASAYVAGPLSERLTASVALAHDRVGGITYNATLDKDVNAVRTDQARFKLHYESPSERGPDATLSVYFLRDRSDNGTPTPLNVPNPDPRVTYDNLDLQIHNDAFQASLTTSWPLTDNLTLKTITGYRQFENDPQPWSLDGLPGDLFSWQLNLDQQQLSQEVQLQGDYGKITFTGGAIYYHEEFDSDRPNVTFGNRGGVRSETVTDSYSIYGQGRYAFNDRLGVTAGLRYYRQEDEYDNLGYVSDADFQFVRQTYAIPTQNSTWDGVTPKFGIDYKFTDQLFGYASITVGEKSGGYNPVAGAPAIAIIPVDPERVTAYEAGFKFGSGRSPYQLNVTAFYNDFQDYQTALSNVILNGTLVNGSVTINADQAETYGVEAEAVARPVDNLELKLAATVLEAEFVDFNFQTALGSGSYDGNRVPYASEVNLAASAAYTIPLGRAGDVRLKGEVKYTSDSFSDITNNTEVPEQTYVNLDAVYTTTDGRWSGVFRVRNLLDETYAIGGIPRTPTIPGILTTSYNPPRLFQFGLTYNF